MKIEVGKLYILQFLDFTDVVEVLSIDKNNTVNLKLICTNDADCESVDIYEQSITWIEEHGTLINASAAKTYKLLYA